MSARASSRSMNDDAIQLRRSSAISSVQKDGRGRPRLSVIPARRDFGRGFSTRQGGLSPVSLRLSSRWSDRVGLFGSDAVAMLANRTPSGASSVAKFEHLREERLAPALLAAERNPVVVIVVVVAGAARDGSRARGGGVAFDELVEFTAVEPDAAALRAVVDLDALAVGHGQGGAVNGAVHWGGLLVV